MGSLVIRIKSLQWYQREIDSPSLHLCFNRMLESWYLTLKIHNVYIIKTVPRSSRPAVGENILRCSDIKICNIFLSPWRQLWLLLPQLSCSRITRQWYLPRKWQQAGCPVISITIQSLRSSINYWYWVRNNGYAYYLHTRIIIYLYSRYSPRGNWDWNWVDMMRQLSP